MLFDFLEWELKVFSIFHFNSTMHIIRRSIHWIHPLNPLIVFCYRRRSRKIKTLTNNNNNKNDFLLLLKDTKLKWIYGSTILILLLLLLLLLLLKSMDQWIRFLLPLFIHSLMFWLVFGHIPFCIQISIVSNFCIVHLLWQNGWLITKLIPKANHLDDDHHYQTTLA